MGVINYTELTDFARRAPALKTLVDPDFSEFLKVGDMGQQIRGYCELTGQPIPATEGEMIRSILEGLALRYRFIIEQLETMSGKKVAAIHIVGGGTKNTLLNQFTADATGKRVVTGPIEATAIGNLITQAIAMGDIAGWEEGVSVIRNSFPIKVYDPGDKSPWDAAYTSFLNNLEKVELAF